MANSTFLPPGSDSIVDHHYFITPNPYPNSLQLPNCMIDDQSYSSDNWFPAGFDFSDYYNLHAFDDHLHLPTSEESISSFTASASMLQTPLNSHDMASSGSSASASSLDCMSKSMNKYHMQVKCKKEINRAKREEEHIIAFRTRTELETLDDGYKWRKYGKKTVKSNPNPRNYYKCADARCKVKKRIERDGEDSSYLVTTYEGIHNHKSPSIMYYDEIPFTLSHGWSLQPSHPFS